MIKNNLFKPIALSLGLALTLIAGFSTSATAQYGADEGYQSNEKGSGVYGDTPSGIDPLDIMHRAQQTNGRSAAEFSEESQTQLSNSASDFKLLQQQRILEQQNSKTNENKIEIEAVEATE
ncbi:MAG: hypothetical protein AAFO95_12805 [Cyanobacteria bacterium J06600_6]